jgi:hypothetical protein
MDQQLSSHHKGILAPVGPESLEYKNMDLRKKHTFSDCIAPPVNPSHLSWCRLRGFAAPMDNNRRRPQKLTCSEKQGGCSLMQCCSLGITPC